MSHPQETADIETSSPTYAGRFAGPAGEWMLARQAELVLGFMKRHPGATVLDVGGGHGQLALPLARAGHRVTVAGSDPSCRQMIDDAVTRGEIAFDVADLLHLPYADKQFDVVTCIRFLPHCERWEEAVRELCRVARRAVIVDYPTVRSLNAFSRPLFALKKGIEKTTRPFRLFRRGAMNQAFGEHGFRLVAGRPQYFWPMVLHRMLGRPAVSRLLEALPRAVGLTLLLGSPILALFEEMQ
jgi:SAM-dependent methyltransferase